MIAHAVWLGGFTFYGAVVLWVLHDEYGSLDAGRITQRVTEVKTRAEFDAWLFRVGREDEKVRDLEKKQKGVFGQPK